MNPDILTEEKLKRLVVDQLGVDAKDIAETSTMGSLGADDLDMIELVMAVEEETGKSLDSEEGDALCSDPDLTFGQLLKNMNQVLAKS